ncbi:MAG: hypothetical protein NWE93_02900 [Candidatus Bathyarchaeota archaeon]|nr:hypothetical protein [Candidatus Bathyarchaeota archaeon]
MVEIEVRKAEPQCESTQSSIDINEIVGKVRDLIGNIREMGSSGEPMSVNVEGFNVAVSKDRGEYEFALKLNLVFKPKTIVDAKCPG